MGGKNLVGLAFLAVVTVIALFGLGAFDPLRPQSERPEIRATAQQNKEPEAAAALPPRLAEPLPSRAGIPSVPLAPGASQGGDRTTAAAVVPVTEKAGNAPAIMPRFDVVRVGARGSAVIAGRAAPGAEIVLLDGNGRELGRARADRRGEVVILPADPLPPGWMELFLLAIQ